jgi:flavin reductase (DIM6/NTAB) family NADH-FMN oxidoreductase RutF
MSFDSRLFRDALGCFATGVTVVSSVAPDGQTVGVTVNSFASVSLNPPLVVFNLDRATNSLRHFQVGRPFAVNVLSQAQEGLSRHFSATGDKNWNGAAHVVWDSGCPILENALANMEGEVVSNHDGGDHVIVLGRVRRLRINDNGRPLLFYRGRHIGLGQNR